MWKVNYYMLDKNDISVVSGIVNTKDVMKELGITNAQFHKMLRNEETYKGCILLPVETDEEERRKVTSEDAEQSVKVKQESDITLQVI